MWFVVIIVIVLALVILILAGSISTSAKQRKEEVERSEFNSNAAKRRDAYYDTIRRENDSGNFSQMSENELKELIDSNIHSFKKDMASIDLVHKIIISTGVIIGLVAAINIGGLLELIIIVGVSILAAHFYRKKSLLGIHDKYTRLGFTPDKLNVEN